MSDASLRTTRPAPAETIRPVEAALRRLSIAARAMLLGQRAAAVLAGVIGAVVLAGLADYVLRFPTGMRWFHFTLGALITVALLWRRIAPAWRFRPTPTALALRIERLRPGLRGVLASGVEFADPRRPMTGPASFRGDPSPNASGSGADLESFLAASVVGQAADRWRSEYGDSRTSPLRLRALRFDGLVKALGCLIAAAAIAGAFTLARPELAAISTLRTLAPWAGAEWPKRTRVVDVTDVAVHPLGAAVPLRAAVLKSNRSFESTDVAARHRIIRGGEAGPSTRDLLTWQERDVAVAPSPDAAPPDAGNPGAAPVEGRMIGALFERLIEADGDAIEYRFETADDQTEWRRIRLVAPPTIVAAKATITPPAYAAAMGQATPGGEDSEPAIGLAVESRDMGPGRDERAVAPRALAGSAVELALTLNKPVPASPGDEAWLRTAIGNDAVAAGATFTTSSQGAAWTLRWRLTDSLRLPINLVDEHGITSVDESVFRFEAEQDHPPTATVTEPESDRTVLATAIVDVIGEGRDDVGLASVSLERRVAGPAGAPSREPSGPGGAMEPRGDAVEVARADSPAARAAQVEARIDLSTLGVGPGDEVWLTAVASDIYAMDGAARPPVRSATRRLRVISEADFIQEIRNELAGVRQTAIRIHEQQQQTRDRVARWGADPASRRGQAQVSERLARQGESIDRLADRAKMNNLADEQLGDLLGEAAALIDEAGRESGNASRVLDEAAGDRPQEAVAPEPGAAERGSDPPRGADGAPAEQRSASAQRPGETDAPRDPPSEGASPSSRPTPPSGSESPSARPTPPSESGGPSSRGAAGASDANRGSEQQGGESQPGQAGGQAGAESPQQRPQGEQSQPSDEPQAQAEGPDKERALDEQKAAEVEAAQRNVEESLDSLISLLDRGEDSWVMRRALDEALRRQKDLRQQTAQAGQRTAGRSTPELNQAERSELDNIVQKQSELADAMADVAKQLEDRSKRLQSEDPAAAAGMSQAAQRAQQSQTSQTMQQAAREAQQNRMAAAGQQQEQAIQDLEEMLKDMDRAERAQEEALRRVLASLMESLDGLIRRQAAEIAALGEAGKTGQFTGLDRAMILLNQNTLGVLDQARQAGREVASVAELVGGASAAQGRAIVALRQNPVESPAALEQEQASLDLLKRARAEAERIDRDQRQKQQDKQRREIRREYREILEVQVALREETAPFAQIDPLSRRDRASVRALSETQTEIADRLAEMLKKTGELANAKVFEYAHKRLDRHAAASARALSDGEPVPALPPQDSAIAMLQGLVRALQEIEQKKDDFNKGAQQGGGAQGSGGEQPLIPPLAELRLLRQIQADVADGTRDAAGEGGPAVDVIEDLGRQQRELNTIGEDLIRRMNSRRGAPMPVGGAQ